MLLAANTLANLEIYCNETDKSTHGSLMWILDRTKTKFGARLLRDWVGRPLIDKRYNRCMDVRKHLLIFLTVFFRTVLMPSKSSKGVPRRNWLLFVRFWGDSLILRGVCAESNMARFVLLCPNSIMLTVVHHSVHLKSWLFSLPHLIKLRKLLMRPRHRKMLASILGCSMTSSFHFLSFADRWRTYSIQLI